MIFFVASASLSSAPNAQTKTWRGLKIAPEERCSAYDRKRDYYYSQSVKREIVRQLGAIYGPYTGTCFSSLSETDIEHIIATSEAHDSGLCRQNREMRTRFANDIRNLTLALPKLNRHQKIAKDAAEWLPERNQCWFANRVVEVRQIYGLTIDPHEVAALEQILSDCSNTQMEPLVCHRTFTTKPQPDVKSSSLNTVHSLNNDIGNGRIYCNEGRWHWMAPVRRSHPAYRHFDYGDEHGIICPL